MLQRVLALPTSALALTALASTTSVRAFSVLPSRGVARLSFQPTTSVSQQRQLQQRQALRTLFGGAGSLEFASSEEIKKALEDPNSKILDVRGPDEIAATGHWKPQGAPHPWVHLPNSPADASLLETTASSLLPDPTKPVLIHCASGMRASKAKQVLDDLGYEQVLNVGGWNEVQDFEKN